MTETVSSKRKDWLDALRGIMIILVILVHTIPSESHVWYVYNTLIGPIMIPMFFVISGYVFNGRGGNQLVFYKNLLRKLIIPSFVLFWGIRVPLIPFKGVSYFISNSFKFISGETHWYIIACIIAEIIFFYNLKFCKNTLSVCLTACACCVAGFLMDHWNIGHFAMINRAFIAQFFLVIGFVFRKYEENIQRLRWPVITIGGLIYIAMTVATFYYWPQQSIDVHLNKYYNIPYCFSLILIVCLFLMTCGSKIGKSSKILALIGRHTLSIYLLHGFCTSLGKRFLPLDSTNVIILLLKVLVITVFALFICTLFSIVLNYIWPEIMGRPRKKTQS